MLPGVTRVEAVIRTHAVEGTRLKLNNVFGKLFTQSAVWV